MCVVKFNSQWKIQMSRGKACILPDLDVNRIFFNLNIPKTSLNHSNRSQGYGPLLTSAHDLFFSQKPHKQHTIMQRTENLMQEREIGANLIWNAKLWCTFTCIITDACVHLPWSRKSKNNFPQICVWAIKLIR